MEFDVKFNWKPPGESNLYDAVQDDTIVFKESESIALPDIGDTVSLTWGGERRHFKVVSRHFSFSNTYRGVNIVIEDVTTEEMSLRVADF